MFVFLCCQSVNTILIERHGSGSYESIYDCFHMWPCMFLMVWSPGVAASESKMARLDERSDGASERQRQNVVCSKSFCCHRTGCWACCGQRLTEGGRGGGGGACLDQYQLARWAHQSGGPPPILSPDVLFIHSSVLSAKTQGTPPLHSHSTPGHFFGVYLECPSRLCRSILFHT